MSTSSSPLPPSPHTALAGISHKFRLFFVRYEFNIYKVVQIWPGQTVTCLHTISPGHIWTTLYIERTLILVSKRPGLSPRRHGFVPRSVHVRFVVNKEALGQNFVWVFRFSLVSIIIQMLRIHNLTGIVTLVGQVGKACKPLNKAVLFRVSEGTACKSTSILLFWREWLCSLVLCVLRGLPHLFLWVRFPRLQVRIPQRSLMIHCVPNCGLLFFMFRLILY
jgi:hypothetical protein